MHPFCSSAYSLFVSMQMLVNLFSYTGCVYFIDCAETSYWPVFGRVLTVSAFW